MGKTYDFVEEIDNGISFIRRLLQDANISVNELKIQSGIKFVCSTGSTFILYFSKGKTSKIYFEKEDKEVLSLMDKLSVKKEETGFSKVPVYANYSISESNQDLVQLKIEESFSIIKKLNCLTEEAVSYRRIILTTFNLKIFLANPIFLKSAIM